MLSICSNSEEYNSATDKEFMHLIFGKKIVCILSMYRLCHFLSDTIEQLSIWYLHCVQYYNWFQMI